MSERRRGPSWARACVSEEGPRIVLPRRNGGLRNGALEWAREGRKEARQKECTQNLIHNVVKDVLLHVCL